MGRNPACIGALSILPVAFAFGVLEILGRAEELPQVLVISLYSECLPVHDTVCLQP